MENRIYIEKRDCFFYPNKNDYFNPSYKYPEYLWGEKELSTSINTIYDMVRCALFGIGLDKENYNKPNWNPLGKLIRPGNNILIKPNLIISDNDLIYSRTDNCIVTHPSIIRPLIDYILIATKKECNITIGESASPGCDIERLINGLGFDRLIEFYRKKNINIKFKDFRLVKLYKHKYIYGDLKDNYKIINLKESSAFYNLLQNDKRFGNPDWGVRRVVPHFNKYKCEYVIPNEILESDVIISVPKIKTHCKTLLTAALKNSFGMVAHKDWLPHYMEGSIEEGGDEYIKKNIYRKLITHFLFKIRYLSESSALNYYFFILLSRIAFKLISIICNEDNFYFGSFYGNDTLHRAISDINKIIFYADKNGKIKNVMQRKCFYCGDMIIGGEGEGPLKCKPRKSGIIIVGFNPIFFDIAVANIMGYEINKIKIIQKLLEDPFWLNFSDKNNYIFYSNYNSWNNVSEIKRNISLNYEPPYGWKNILK